MLLYIGTEKTNIIKYYIDKCPYIKIKTYNYLVDYYLYIKNNNLIVKKKQLYLISIYNNIIETIKSTNIIYPTNPLYDFNIYDDKIIIDHINENFNWIYDNIKETTENKILDEI